VTDPILLYGATGYTASLVIDEMLRQGLRPILSARAPDALRARAERACLSYRPARLDHRGSLKTALDGMQVMLNLAGPYGTTSEPAIEACLETGVHYLDVSGEVDSVAKAARRHREARAQGIMLMPGAGFDVVPSDCLCAHAGRRLRDIQTLRIAVSGLDLASPGSLRTLAYELGRPTRVRHGGALRELPPGELTRRFDFGDGLRPCTAVSWADLVTAPVTTGATNVETYFESTAMVAAFVQYNRQLGWMHRLPWAAQWLELPMAFPTSGPTAEQRATRRATIVVEAEDSAGRSFTSTLSTPEVYSLTAQTATNIAGRVLAGDTEPGFQTPARLFGADFILRFSGVTRTDREAKSGS
jgi:short subunit dehydrogenase-like uncharacterized protein